MAEKQSWNEEIHNLSVSTDLSLKLEEWIKKMFSCSNIYKYVKMKNPYLIV